MLLVIDFLFFSFVHSYHFDLPFLYSYWFFTSNHNDRTNEKYLYAEPLISNISLFYPCKTCLTLNNNNNSFTDCTHYRPTIEGLAALGALHASHMHTYARIYTCTRDPTIRTRAHIHTHIYIRAHSRTISCIISTRTHKHTLVKHCMYNFLFLRLAEEKKKLLKLIATSIDF